MTTSEHAPNRLLRGSIAAAVGTGLGLLGHSLAFGSLNNLSFAVPVAVVIALAAAIIGWAAAAEQRGWLFVAGFVLAVQLSVHVSMSAIPHLELLVISEPASPLLHNHADMMQGAPASPDAPMALVWAAMLVAHTLAAGFASLVLVRGERWVWACARKIVERVLITIQHLADRDDLAYRDRHCHALRWHLPLSRSCKDGARAMPRRGPPQVPVFANT